MHPNQGASLQPWAHALTRNQTGDLLVTGQRSSGLSRTGQGPLKALNLKVEDKEAERGTYPFKTIPFLSKSFRDGFYSFQGQDVQGCAGKAGRDAAPTLWLPHPTPAPLLPLEPHQSHQAAWLSWD